MKSSRKATPALIETLENRTLFSVGVVIPAVPESTPLTFAKIATSTGKELVITGTPGSDQISVYQRGPCVVVADAGFPNWYVMGKFSSIKIVGNGGNDNISGDSSVKTPMAIYGGTGNDTLTGGNSNDSIWGGGGTDSITAGNGNDTIVTIGDTAATIVGGPGYDSFWTDNNGQENISNVSAAEIAGGTVHNISGFLQQGATLAATTISLLGRSFTIYTPPTGTSAIANPNAGGASYQNFSNSPLFSSAGPTADDIFQGGLGDCFFEAELSAVAQVDPNRIQQSIVDLGDGTYAVGLTNKGGVEEYVRVDGQLPVSGGTPIYGGLGQQGSIWAALMEKAFAAVNDGTDSYQSINYGLTGQGFAVLGGTNIVGISGFSNGQQLLSMINTDLVNGLAVSFAMGDHVYEVSSVDMTDQLITFRNPWGMYETMAASDAYAAFAGAAVANV